MNKTSCCVWSPGTPGDSLGMVGSVQPVTATLTGHASRDPEQQNIKRDLARAQRGLAGPERASDSPG